MEDKLFRRRRVVLNSKSCSKFDEVYLFVFYNDDDWWKEKVFRFLKDYNCTQLKSTFHITKTKCLYVLSSHFHYSKIMIVINISDNQNLMEQNLLFDCCNEIISR